MKKLFIVFSFIFLVLIALRLGIPQKSFAQAGQIWETIVGNPVPEPEVGPDPDPGGDPGGGGNDGLGPGEFRNPFKCDLTYVGKTRVGHTPFSVDFTGLNGTLGTPVRAVADGKIATIIPSCGQVTIWHEGNYYSTYGHMRNITVRETDRVSVGQKIGEIASVSNPSLGCNSTGPHLHTHHSKNQIYGNYIKLTYNGVGYPASLNPGRAIGPGFPIKGRCP